MGKLVSMLGLRQCNVPLFRSVVVVVVFLFHIFLVGIWQAGLLTSPIFLYLLKPSQRDLHGCVQALLAVLQPSSPFATLVPSLQAIVAHESGLDVPEAVLLNK